jgi:predicted O-methyltransferase YrrM
MSSRSFAVDPKIEEYVDSVNPPESRSLAELRRVTHDMPNGEMQIGDNQGQFMTMLAKLIGAKRYLEIGVFTGYSSLAMAAALPPDGQVVGLDISEEFTTTARKHWKEVGLDNNIELRIGPAVESLEALVAEGQAGKFDLAFIDADKENNPIYLAKCLELVRTNGLILIDNVLRAGKVIQPDARDSIKWQLEFNASLKDRSDIEVLMLPLFDGITLIRKK